MSGASVGGTVTTVEPAAARSPIRALGSQVAAQIAAGEVIERPAAVLKELVENSVDAGARRIEVALSGAGQERIAVHDDGCGIPTDQLRLALSRHATSKLRQVDDLSRIASYGFRGEALPAIAAAAGRLTLTSRARGTGAGATIELELGRVVREQAAARAEGTSVEVIDLFRGQPARRAFQGSGRAERRALTRVASDLILARPTLGLRLMIDGRTPLAHQPSAAADAVALPEAMAAVFRSGVAERALPIVGERGALSVDGLCGSPDDVRRTRDGIRLFVNARPVHDRRLQYAVEEAYRDWIARGSHPIAVVRLWLPPELVDVNIHPAKTEVKLREPDLAFSLVQRSIRAALSEARSSVPLRLDPDDLEFAHDAGASQLPLSLPSLPRTGRVDSVPRQAVAEPAASGRAYADSAPAARPVLPPLRVVGQMHRTFIVAEGPDGLVLVDQHAAHERVVYERLLAAAEPTPNGASERQPLIEPLILELDAEEASVWSGAAGRLRALGFDVEPFGERAMWLRSVPGGFELNQAESVVRGILRDLAVGRTVPERFDPVVASAACHGSVRRGAVLDIAAMRDLLRQLERCEHPHACPHGRPTLVEISSDDVLRRFRRK